MKTPPDLVEQFKARERRTIRRNYATERENRPVKPPMLFKHGKFHCSHCHYQKPLKGKKKVGVKFICADCNAKRLEQ